MMKFSWESGELDTKCHLEEICHCLICIKAVTICLSQYLGVRNISFRIGSILNETVVIQILKTQRRFSPTTNFCIYMIQEF